MVDYLVADLVDSSVFDWAAHWVSEVVDSKAGWSADARAASNASYAVEELDSHLVETTAFALAAAMVGETGMI